MNKSTPNCVIERDKIPGASEHLGVRIYYKKDYGGALLDIEIWSNDNSESIKHPRRWLGSLMGSSFSLADHHPWHLHSGLGLAPARLGRCGDVADTIFEILLAALKYTEAKPRCISGLPGVFKKLYPRHLHSRRGERERSRCGGAKDAI